MPFEEIIGAFRHVRNHLQQHDGFVEVIQIIGGKPGAGVDVGGLQQRSPRGGITAASPCLVPRDLIMRMWQPSWSSGAVLTFGVKRT